MPTETTATVPTSTRPATGGFRGPGRIVVYTALVLIGVVLGATIGGPQKADAEVRKGPERKAFMAGGERSELVLIEIAGIITRMDGRLARIEKAIDLAAKQGPPR